MSKRFKMGVCDEIVFEVNFKKKFDGEESYFFKYHKDLLALFEDLLKVVDCEKTDLMRVFIDQEGLYAPIIVGPQRAARLTAENIMEEAERVMQSAQEVRLDNSFRVSVAVLRPPNDDQYAAGGRTPVIDFALGKGSLYKKKSILTIHGADDNNLCAARAILLADAHAKKNHSLEDMRRYRRFYQNFRLLTWYASVLQEEVGLEATDAVALKDLPLFEERLRKAIVVYSAADGNKLVYSGAVRRYDDIIYLLLVKGKGGLYHYNVITTIKGFLGFDYHCRYCNKGYNNKAGHSCKYTCSVCLFSNCFKDATARLCSECNALCRSQGCYERHLQPSFNTKRSPCQTYAHCEHCGRGGRRSTFLPHKCYQSSCRI